MTEQAQLRIIGLMGKSKSGKDTVGQMLVEKDPRGATLAFADKLKEMIMDIFGATHDDLYTDEGKKSKTKFPLLKCPACSSIQCESASDAQVLCRKCTAVGERKSFMTHWEWREIAQFAGTEFGRFVDKDVWVRHAVKRARYLLGVHGPDEVVPTRFKPQSFIAITDCRFKSEKAAIVAAGGEVWRIRRPETDNRSTGLVGHQSETEMDTIPDNEFAVVLNNDATLEVLRAKVDEQFGRFLKRHE